MLLENKTPRLKLVKLFLIVPVLIGMIIFSSACQSDSQKNQQNESLPSHTAVPVDSLASQNDHSETKNYFPYAEIEIPPVPHNDEYNSIDEFRQWISHNFIIPSEALAANATGLMEASFIIDEKGEIVNVEIIKDIGYGTGEILKSLLEESSLRWKPGINNGIPVATKYTLPVQIYTTP